ncbi:TIGR04219 family outer membrane beta-barrel protein [Desulfothermus okinawensis JCM 13304]
MNKKNLMVTAFILVFFMMPALAFAIGAEVSLGMWQQDPNGYFSYKGEHLSVDDELRYDTETKLLARAKIDMPLFIPNIYLMYTPMDFDGNGIKSKTFKFGDVTFKGNVPFKSELQLDQYDIALYYGVPFLNTLSAGILNVEAGLNCKIIDFYGKVKQPDLSLSESKSTTIPIPMVYLGVQVKPIKWISLEGEARGIAYSGSGYYDFIGRVKIHPFGPLFLSGGYRYEKVEIDYTDVDSDIEFSGPFLEVGVSF